MVWYGHGARAYIQATRCGTWRSSAAEHGTSRTSLDPGLDGTVVREEVRLQRRFDEVRSAFVRFVEERRHAGLDEIAAPFEGGDVRGREAESSRSVGDGAFIHGAGDGLGQRAELLLELRRRQPRRVSMPRDIAGRTRGRLPRVMMRTNLARPSQQDEAKHLDRARIGCDGVRDDVGRPHAVSLEARVQLRKGSTGFRTSERARAFASH